LLRTLSSGSSHIDTLKSVLTFQWVYQIAELEIFIHSGIRHINCTYLSSDKLIQSQIFKSTPSVSSK
jgi:hypothetical protein